MTNEEYEQAVCDEGQRRRLTFDMEVRAMIKEAVEIEREACAKVCEEIAAYYSTDIFPEDGTSIDCNSAKMGRAVTKNCAMEIRARGQG